jgi:hypothetical protein
MVCQGFYISRYLKDHDSRLDGAHSAKASPVGPDSR